MSPAGDAPRRALVLAAGFGERLRPLTELTPKPLLPVLGVPILKRTLERLAAAGVERTVVNLHHLGEQIRERLGRRLGRMRLEYAPEEVLLGTLGPLAAAADILGESEAFLVVNGDSLCRWPIRAVVRKHRKAAADATLLLSARADPEAFGGGVVADREGRILGFGGGEPEGAARCGVFTGLHVVSSALLAGLEARPSDIVRDLYEPLLERGAHIRAVFTRRQWYDLGTPERYLEGVLGAARRSFVAGRVGFSWRGEGARVGSRSRVRSTVMEAGSAVAPAARVERSLLMAKARVGRGAVVHRSIVGPGVVLAPQSRLEGQLVTRRLPGVRPRPEDSVVGDLVYSPMEP